MTKSTMARMDAKETFRNAKAATEQATNLFQHTVTVAAKSAQDYNNKLLDFAQANTNVAFEFVQRMLGVKSPSEFIELSTEHARKQFETLTEQTKELTALAQKVSIETAAPFKAEVNGAFNKLA
jgi:phasin